MKKNKLPTVYGKIIEDYAFQDLDGDWMWLPSTFERYTEDQLERLEDRWQKKGYHVTIGRNSIIDLFQRVAALEKKK